ncbi:MAG: CPBP family intramembrane glutamic endopeptidase [Bacteroidota bacterium]
MFMFNMSIVSAMALFAAQSLFQLDNITEVLAGSITDAQTVYAFLFIQGVSTLGGFALTAMMFAVLESGEFIHHLRLKIYPSVKMIGLAVLAIVVAQFFIEFLVEVNQMIPLPTSLQFLYDYQKQAEEVTNALLSFTGFGQFIATALVMAVFPAVAEEFFFRGLLLGDLLKGKVNPAIAIGTTGLIFAISHGQYDNTIAIWALGAFLGYLYYISGSLWLPIAAHFINNFFAVLLKYLFNLGIISSDFAEAKTPLYLTLLSLVIFAALVFLFNKWKNPPTFVEEEEEEDSESLNENTSA